GDLLRGLAAVHVLVQDVFDADAVSLDADVVGSEEIEVVFQLHRSPPDRCRPGPTRSRPEGQMTDLVAELIRLAGAPNELEVRGQFVNVPLRIDDKDAEYVPPSSEMNGKMTGHAPSVVRQQEVAVGLAPLQEDRVGRPSTGPS